MECKVLDGMEDFSAPINVFLNLTQRCNMRCIYCYAEVHTVTEKWGHNELTDEEFLSLVDELIEAKVFRYLITGGEPFLRRELLFNILQKIGNHGHVLLYTNGTMITAEVARRLAALGIRIHILISIDAPVEEINAITRGRGFLAKAVRGVQRLMEQGIIPGVNCTLTKVNHKIIPQLIDFLKQLGVKELHIIHFQPIGYGVNTAHLTMSPKERLAFSEQILRLRNEEKSMRIIADDDECWFGFEKEYQRLIAHGTSDPKPKTLLPCSAGIHQCNITADGWVTPCNYMLSYRCGNVREQSVLEIWRNSPQLKRLRLLRHTPITEIPECSTCEYNIFCRGGCRALAFTTTGDLLGLDASCPYYERQNQEASHRQSTHSPIALNREFQV